MNLFYYYQKCEGKVMSSNIVGLPLAAQTQINFQCFEGGALSA